MKEPSKGDNFCLFDFVPEVEAREPQFDGITHKIWTENKARLVHGYLYRFVFVTRHGTYVDGFAGQQYPGQERSWCSKEVIESRPRWLRNFFLCDADRERVAELRGMVDAQPPRELKESTRRFEIHCGDFNRWVDDVLASGVITDTEATFALLDQRTFECLWPTVAKLAQHKRQGNKIELFYFLPVGWMHRALSKRQDLDTIKAWWGNDEWEHLRDASTESIRATAVRRFKEELGYKYAIAWPIFAREDGGRIMYYMIHASDHPEAPKLMQRAYKTALGTPEPIEQLEIEYPAP